MVFSSLLFTGMFLPATYLVNLCLPLGASNLFLLAASVLACTPLVRNLSEHFARSAFWRGCRKSLIPILLLLLSTCALVGESYNPFLYFQF